MPICHEYFVISCREHVRYWEVSCTFVTKNNSRQSRCTCISNLFMHMVDCCIDFALYNIETIAQSMSSEPSEISMWLQVSLPNVGEKTFSETTPQSPQPTLSMKYMQLFGMLFEYHRLRN